MTLGVNIIDTTTNQSLNESGKRYGVVIDDTISDIKAKIFANTVDFYKETIMYYPNLVNVSVKVNGVLQTISDNNPLLFYYPNPPTTPEIYVSSIFDEIVGDKYEEFDLEPYSMYNKFKTDDNVITDLYDKLVLRFPDMTQDDLVYIIKMRMLNFNRASEVSVIGSGEMANLTDDIKRFFNGIKQKYESDVKKYRSEAERLAEFYRLAYTFATDTYYERSVNNLPVFTYTNVNIQFVPEDYDSSVAGKFIKLDQIFNMMELTEHMPLIAFNNHSRRDPKIKVYNRLADVLPENSIKGWILNERKRLGRASYKKIRGLMAKCQLKNITTSKPQNKYVTITLNERGIFTVRVNFEEDDNQTSIPDIIQSVSHCISEFIEEISRLHGVFTKSKRLHSIDRYKDASIVSVNAVLETTRSINRSKFRKILTKHEASRIFDAKDIKDTKDMISMYYRSVSKRDADDDTERLGITVNIKDNPYKMNSTAIVIYGSTNLNQLAAIVDNIVILAEISDRFKTNIFEESDSEGEEFIVKERKQNVKRVRELGGKMSSVTCQKKRQPKIDNDTTITDPELVMDYRGNRYVCSDTGKHKYPGLAGDIPCCFEHPGKGMSSIVSANILEIKVQPSNFNVTISQTDADGTRRFTTRVIKLVTEDLEGFDLERSRYFYLDNNVNAEFPLVHIHNEELVKRINSDQTNAKGETIWLAEVPLYQLVSKPKKNTCLHTPHLHKRTLEDQNAQCKHHDKERTFGYNMKSYPCCFEKEQPVYRAPRVDRGGVVKQHIITTDKLLGHKRQGVLQPGLNRLFNEVLKREGGAFLRWGVNQNQLSFLNCIVESVSEIDSTFALKRYLLNYLNNNPDEFLRLGNGNISLKWGTLEEYTNAIMSERVIDWTDIIDLVQIALGCNILVIEIPYVESLSKTTFAYSDMRLVCNLNVHQDLTKPFLILVKKQRAFEVVVFNSSARWNSESQVIQMLEQQPVVDFLFRYNPKTPKTPEMPPDDIVTFLVDYYKNSCVKENRFPERYPYDELYNGTYVVETLRNTANSVVSQLINAFNKVNLLVTNGGLLIPIKETGVIDGVPTEMFDDFVLGDRMIDINRVTELLTELKLEPPMSLLGVTVKHTERTVDDITGVVTNFGQTLPVKRTPMTPEIRLSKSVHKYYTDVDATLAGKLGVVNPEKDWNTQIQMERDNMFSIKKRLGESLVKRLDIQNQIIEINKTPGITKFERIDKIKQLLRDYIRDVPDVDFILDNISNEITNDNVENLLLNNLITSEVFNPDEITKRPTESVWLNVDDIKKWFRRFRERQS